MPLENWREREFKVADALACRILAQKRERNGGGHLFYTTWRILSRRWSHLESPRAPEPGSQTACRGLPATSAPPDGCRFPAERESVRSRKAICSLSSS